MFCYYVNITDKSTKESFERRWECETSTEAINNTFEDLLQDEGYDLHLLAISKFEIVCRLEKTKVVN